MSETLSNEAIRVFTGGDVVTMNDDMPAAEAVAVREGRILAVGALDEVLRAAGKDAELVDLGGKCLMPSFIDAHGHFANAPRVITWANVSSPPAGPVESIPDVVRVLKEHVGKIEPAPGEWIVGYGYDSDGLEEKRNITVDDLDPHFSDNPVMLIHVSNHGCVMNSAGFALFNITAGTPTPPGGLILRKEGSREPAGLVMETAFLPIFAQVPQPTEEELLDLLKPAQLMYAAKGVTTIAEGATHAHELALLRKAAAQKRLFLDVVSLPMGMGGELFKAFAEYIVVSDDQQPDVIGHPEYEFGSYQNRLKLGGVKLAVDGSPQGKTAFWSEPLLTPGPAGEENWRGAPLLPPESLTEIYRALTDRNIQVWTHANGDAAIDMVIDAATAAGVKADDDRRHVVVHSNFMRPDQLDEYVRLGLTPTFFTVHAFYWGDVHLANLGQERAFFLSPMRSAQKRGIRFSNHNDFMVTPVDPMFMIWSAVHRISRNGVVIGPNERVDVWTALRALTIDAAYQYFEEDTKGSLKPGKLADLVILSANPLKVEPMTIKDITVEETFKEGETVYRR
jgi:predicted amidohydrolase YtcJ